MQVWKLIFISPLSQNPFQNPQTKKGSEFLELLLSLLSGQKNEKNPEEKPKETKLPQTKILNPPPQSAGQILPLFTPEVNKTHKKELPERPIPDKKPELFLRPPEEIPKNNPEGVREKFISEKELKTLTGEQREVQRAGESQRPQKPAPEPLPEIKPERKEKREQEQKPPPVILEIRGEERREVQKSAPAPEIREVRVFERENLKGVKVRLKELGIEIRLVGESARLKLEVPRAELITQYDAFRISEIFRGLGIRLESLSVNGQELYAKEKQRGRNNIRVDEFHHKGDSSPEPGSSLSIFL
ncbi:MAG: hypothetical protein GXO04_04415 [Aquificae bacterium]|nr:hypothetical protein [Aquificota bacterium]